jgi:hypothetical protein
LTFDWEGVNIITDTPDVVKRKPKSKSIYDKEKESYIHDIQFQSCGFSGC